MGVRKIADVQFKAHSVRHLLDQLLDIQRRRERGEDLTLPSITLHLISGREISGYILDIIRSEAGSSVILQTDIERERPKVVYTDVEKIEAIGFFQRTPRSPVAKQRAVRPPPPVQRPKNMPPPLKKAPVNALKETVVAPAPKAVVNEGPVVSDTDIQKIIISMQSSIEAALQTSVSIQVAWTTFPKTRASMQALKSLLDRTKSALSTLLENSRRKEELRNQLQSIRISHSAKADIQMESGAWSISAPLANGDAGFASSSDITTQIEFKLF